MQGARWTPVHAADVLRSLEREVFPSLGPLPIREIDAPLVLAALRKIESRGSLETAKRVRKRIWAVLVQAISAGICSTDPAAIVAKALSPARRKTRQPAIADLAELRRLLTAVEASGASPVTKIDSRLLALTAVRPGVLRGPTWAEFEGIDRASSHPEEAAGDRQGLRRGDGPDRHRSQSRRPPGRLLLAPLPGAACHPFAGRGSAMTALACKVLVIDDEPQIRRLLRTILTRADWNVVEAGTAREALRVRGIDKPDAVLISACPTATVSSG